MSTITISPVGAYFIALAVKHWNESTDPQLKERIRYGLLSKDCLLVRKAPSDLRLLSTHHFEKCGVASQFKGYREYVVQALAIVALAGVAHQYDEAALQEIEDTCARDLAFYFATMFDRGHFGKIPAPQCALILDQSLGGVDADSDPEAVAKIAAFMVQKLPEQEIRYGGPPNQAENASPKPAT